MKDKKLIIGTRGSSLALWQANWVKEKLEKNYPEYKIDLIRIKTKGDKILDVALAKVGDKGLFVKEIEEALIRKEVDIAVHSMKDIPTTIPQGLKIGAVCERENPQDVFISKDNAKLEDLPYGSTIGTSSLRRIAQLSSHYPGFKFKDLRGNLNTRFNKLATGEYDGMILAFAGVKRLGFINRITQLIPHEIILPAVGQGAVGIEIRQNDPVIDDIVTKTLLHVPSYITVSAERSLMKRLEGGCQIPIGALGKIEKNNKLVLNALVASLDGKEIHRAEMEGDIKHPEALGLALAEKLISMGADKILKEIITDKRGL
ncbi:MAG: hydroxymethylbilane synthase [Candidatus Firestonebacteria bacterium]|nr:hydroxymethylbilane synthase [Candidatus Firestonebacteria bacterium]